MEVESSTKDRISAKSARNRRCRTICLSLSALLLAVVLLLVILGFTVFKAKRAVTTINSVALDDLHVDLDIPRMKVYLNVSLDIDLSIKNPNKVGFKFHNASALVYYKGVLVGEAPIPAGKISADETIGMNITLTILADRFLSNSGVFSDVLSGTLPLNTFARVSGKVSILKFIKVKVVSETSCDVTLNVLKSSVDNSQCKYKTKF